MQTLYGIVLRDEQINEDKFIVNEGSSVRMLLVKINFNIYFTFDMGLSLNRIELYL